MNDMGLAEEIEEAAKHGDRGYERVWFTANGDLQIRCRNPDEIQAIIAALRRADLAQTEIKGHMRVQDELKAELQEAQRELGLIPIGWQPKHDYLLGELAKTQARIAELEKDAARYRFLRENVRAHDRMVGYCIRAWTFDAPCDIVTLDAAIDEALKSRA